VKEIALTKNQIAFVSDEDFERVSQHKWQASDCGRWKGYEKFYAVTKIYYQGGGGKYRRVYMHRFILEPIPVGMVVDHIDGNSLNNLRTNLRIVTVGQNAIHQRRKQRKVEVFL
jgi:hypothetical protein